MTTEEVVMRSNKYSGRCSICGGKVKPDGGYILSKGGWRIVCYSCTRVDGRLTGEPRTEAEILALIPESKHVQVMAGGAAGPCHRCGTYCYGDCHA